MDKYRIFIVINSFHTIVYITYYVYYCLSCATWLGGDIIIKRLRTDEDKDYKLEWKKAMDELVNLKQEYRELKEDKDYIKSLLDAEFKKGLNLKKEIKQLQKENEQLRKIGVMYQGHNPCETCTYCLENKVCCAEPVLTCDDAKKNFIQGLCKKHKQFQKSIRRYDDE